MVLFVRRIQYIPDVFIRSNGKNYVVDDFILKIEREEDVSVRLKSSDLHILALERSILCFVKKFFTSSK